jgi:hypothetical protein
VHWVQRKQQGCQDGDQDSHPAGASWPMARGVTAGSGLPGLPPVGCWKPQRAAFGGQLPAGMPARTSAQRRRFGRPRCRGGRGKGRTLRLSPPLPRRCPAALHPTPLLPADPALHASAGQSRQSLLVKQ